MTRSTTESKLAEAVGFGADRVDAGIGAAAVGQFHDAVVDILLHEIERLGAGLARQRQTLRHGVDRDHPLGAEQEGAADRELADRPAAPDRDGLAALDVAEIRAPCSRSGKMSDRNSTCSSVSPSGTLIGPTSA